MKLKILLLIIFFVELLQAQVVCNYPEGVISSLIISEVRMDSQTEAYIEITNMGENSIKLSEFKLGRLNAWSESSRIYDLCNDPWYTEIMNGYLFLPDRMLNPGESFVITNAYDFRPILYKEGLGRLGGSERPKQIGIYRFADKLIHMPEPIGEVFDPRDSITTPYNDPEQLTKRGNPNQLFDRLIAGTIYLEHHFAEGDSAVVDQIGGVFDDGGRNRMHQPYDFAGVFGGLGNSVAVRKAYVKNGNIDFANARGIALDDSEWMPLPIIPGTNSWRDIWWTIGNHDNFILNENTLEPLTESIQIDYSEKRITVPWGTLRLDEIMQKMKYKPGIYWTYNLNSISGDSLYRSARTGDTLSIYVVGNTLQSTDFIIHVEDPTSDDNMVIPIDRKNSTGPITTRAQNGILSWPRITRHESGVDTISGSNFGLSFDLRTDSLLKYLEKPLKANWEFVWIDDIARPDLKNGDILRVVSESGKIKEYFIQIQNFWPSTNADLASITWPDIPEFYRGIFGWKGDTIPNFGSGITRYQLEIPVDVEGIPALKAKTSHVNASVKVTRARSLSGPLEDRTIIFEVSAENDTVKKVYQVELNKEKSPNQIEPYIADPFISEFVNVYPNGHVYVEIYNPGNQPLDLRNYMIGMRGASSGPYAPILHNPSWVRRYTTYVPGLKYVDQATWAVTPRYLIPDPNVNSIIPGGGTFILSGSWRREDQDPGITQLLPKIDVEFRYLPNLNIVNPWNENVTGSSTEGFPMPTNGNRKNAFFLYKILNDSIKFGLKPVGDPNDFEVIDAWGMPDYSYWVVGGYALGQNETGNIFIRKSNITKGNPEMGASFGTNENDCEWIRIQPNVEYGYISTPTRYSVAWGSLNQHYMIEPSDYKSTITSSVYKVSEGYGPGEKVLGLKEGVTVAEFLTQINKEDENQTINVISGSDGSEKGDEETIIMNDKLVVVSADKKNSTVYRLDVTEAGLSNNAYLTSTRWNVQVSAEPKSAFETSTGNDGAGNISGFDYGTTIKTIVDNVNVPAGATLTVIDGNGSYVPFTTLNFDTAYVSVTVNPNVYFDVVAEDNVTRMVYQLQPNTSENDAFILSDVYDVSQMDNLIHFVPRGTNFQTFLSNIIPSLGASLKLVDKMGFERVYGNIREDDKVVVTSASGQTTRIYFISFLATSAIPQTTYLAYVLSEAYTVNQVDYIISAGLAPLTSETMLDEFLGSIMPSMGATVVVIDKNGEVKSPGDLNDGDKLQVTSADGKIITTYTLALDLTSAGPVGTQRHIEIFPNPASDKLNIQGIEAGCRIQIYSASGAFIREVKALGNLEMISLEHVPSGVFMIVIINDHKMLGRYKAIRK